MLKILIKSNKNVNKSDESLIKIQKRKINDKKNYQKKKNA